MTKLRQGLSRSEKLKKRGDINHLFAEGKTFKTKPLLIKWQILQADDHEPSLKLLVGVPKKTFKRAVDRNRIKRLIREAYRKHKNPLSKRVCESNSIMRVAIIYSDKSMPVFIELEDKIILILHRLAGYV